MTQQPQHFFDDTIWKAHLALFAPLPQAFVSHIFHRSQELKPTPVISSQPLPLFDQTWMHIQRARENASRLMVPAVDAQKITPRWFRHNFEIYAGRDTALPLTTVQGWQERHLLRSMEYGSLEPNSVSALYMMRYLFKQKYRYWLPRKQKPVDPWFFVYGLLPDETIPRIYPYPLPSDLPANLLLWTHWIGASWQPGWLRVPGIGSLAWGKTRTFAGKWYWHLTEEEMLAWDAEFVRRNSVKQRFALLEPIIQSHDFPDAEKRYCYSRTHTLAELLLEQIGEPILAGHMRHYFEEEKPPAKPYIPF